MAMTQEEVKEYWEKVAHRICLRCRNFRGQECHVDLPIWAEEAMQRGEFSIGSMRQVVPSKKAANCAAFLGEEK